MPWQRGLSAEEGSGYPKSWRVKSIGCEAKTTIEPKTLNATRISFVESNACNKNEERTQSPRPTRRATDTHALG